MFEGRIYKISCIRSDVKQFYVGQSVEKSLETRWNQHKRNAEQLLTKKRSKNDRGKAIKLHQAMLTYGVNSMIIKELEFYEYKDKNELLNKLDERENYFIDTYNLKEEGIGWNKNSASRIKRPLGQDTIETWDSKSKEYGVGTRQLMHQVNKKGLSIEEAVIVINELNKKPIRLYSYGMQTYKVIKELEPFNKNNVDKKTLETRIRTLINKNKLRIDLDKEKNIETVFLIDSIFDPVSSRGEIIVITPDGEEKGKTIIELWKKLLSKYPDYVPDNYNRVQNRINGKRFKVKWTYEQAFGFHYPPGFEEVEELIKHKGYQWGEIDGKQKIPSFKNDYKATTNPIILHSISTIYFKEQDWCDAYKLTDRKQIKKLRDEGKTNEEILKYYGKEI